MKLPIPKMLRKAAQKALIKAAAKRLGIPYEDAAKLAKQAGKLI